MRNPPSLTPAPKVRPLESGCASSKGRANSRASGELLLRAAVPWKWSSATLQMCTNALEDHKLCSWRYHLVDAVHRPSRRSASRRADNCTAVKARALEFLVSHNMPAATVTRLPARGVTRAGGRRRVRARAECALFLSAKSSQSPKLHEYLMG